MTFLEYPIRGCRRIIATSYWLQAAAVMFSAFGLLMVIDCYVANRYLLATVNAVMCGLNGGMFVRHAQLRTLARVELHRCLELQRLLLKKESCNTRTQ